MRLRAGRILLRVIEEVRSGSKRVSCRHEWIRKAGSMRGGSLPETYRRSRSSACAPARVPASHQLFMPAVSVNGMSLAGGKILSGAASDGTPVWVAVAPTVADMTRFLRITVDGIIAE